MLMVAVKDESLSPDAPPEHAAPHHNPLLRWIIVQTFVQAEMQLHYRLLDRGFASMCIPTRRMVRRWKFPQPVLCSAIPGYIFVGLEPYQAIDDIRQFPGFIKVLKVNGIPANLSPGELASISQQERRAYEDLRGAKAEVIHVGIGDWVAAPDGPFEGIPVRIVAIDKHNRVSASLGNVTVTFSLSALSENGAPLVQRNV